MLLFRQDELYREWQTASSWSCQLFILLIHPTQFNSTIKYVCTWCGIVTTFCFLFSFLYTHKKKYSSKLECITLECFILLHSCNFLRKETFGNDKSFLHSRRNCSTEYKLFCNFCNKHSPTFLLFRIISKINKGRKKKEKK